MTTALVHTSSASLAAARARRGWEYVDHAILTALATFPEGTAGVRRLALRLPEGIRQGVTYDTLSAALSAFVRRGLVDEAFERPDGTFEWFLVRRITAAGRAQLGHRDIYQQAA
jgi:hypothetical protein